MQYKVLSFCQELSNFNHLIEFCNYSATLFCFPTCRFPTLSRLPYFAAQTPHYGMLSYNKKTKMHAPCAPFQVIQLTHNFLAGARLPQNRALTIPQRCPIKILQTCIWAYANSRLGIRKRLFGRTQTVENSLQTPCLLPLREHFRSTFG